MQPAIFIFFLNFLKMKDMFGKRDLANQKKRFVVNTGIPQRILMGARGQFLILEISSGALRCDHPI